MVTKKECFVKANQVKNYAENYRKIALNSHAMLNFFKAYNHMKSLMISDIHTIILNK